MSFPGFANKGSSDPRHFISNDSEFKKSIGSMPNPTPSDNDFK